MIAARGSLLAVTAALTLVGCASPPPEPAPASPPPASNTTAAAPTTTAKVSGFCLNLTGFQVGLVVFKADVSKAANGEKLDFEDLKKRAALIEITAKPMREDAPPEIAEQFRQVLDAVATTASRLKPGAKVRDLLDPLYGEATKAAFAAVQDYQKPGCPA